MSLLGKIFSPHVLADPDSSQHSSVCPKLRSGADSEAVHLAWPESTAYRPPIFPSHHAL